MMTTRDRIFNAVVIFAGLMLVMLIASILIGCAAPKRPDGETCAIDYGRSICYRLKIPEQENEEWEYLGERPLSETDKYFAFSPEYMVKLKEYITELKEYYQNKYPK